ncbi:MAG: carboxymuconolactone decarboxylase family protein [bacterium]|nr:carboxymuconolactone decarboxylase family protein [bacterium]
MKQLPKRFKKFKKDFPEVAKAYEELGIAVHKAGPLTEKTRALIKLAISTGAGLEGAVHSHTQAIDAGALNKTAVMLALLTIRFPLPR